MAPLPNAERLLAETAWLRSLAGKLVGDADSALDLQQDVALAALAQPEAPVGRSWLAAVARNLAVTLRRRRSAEQRRLRAVAPHEPVPSAAELVATAELQQRAVAAVLALPQVYRDTVLLRFMQGLSLHAVALAMGVPEETVRTRQKRALAHLRQQLAPRERVGERRSAFAALLAPFVAAGVAVKTKSFVVAAAALLLASVFCFAVPWRAGTEPAVPGAQGAAAAVADAASQPTGAAADEGTAPGARVEVAATGASPAVNTAQLRVRVRWQDGAPAADVPVLCVEHWAERTLRATDAAGEVRFSDLRPGTYSVQTPDFMGKWAELAVGDDRQIELKMRASTEVHGAVVDAAGMPVPFAELLQSMPGVAPQWTFPLGRCDAAGHFRVRVSSSLLGARAARLGVSDFLLLTKERHFVAEPDAITLRLAAAGAPLCGRVVDEHRRPVRGAWVQLGDVVGALHPDDSGELWQVPPARLLVTDEDGRFDAGALRAGSCDLLVDRRGLAPYRERLELVAHVPRELEIVLRPGGLLRGVVTDASGRPIGGAEVESDDLGSPLRGRATTAADGVFALPDLPAGDLECTVSAKGLARAQRTFRFIGAETQEWTVVLDGGLRIVGRLVDDAGEPIAGWRLLRDGSNRGVRTDAEGRFVIADCDASDNGLSVQQVFGFTPIVQRFTGVRPGDDEQTFVVPRSRWPSVRLRGRCVDGNGGPITDVGLDLAQDGRSVLVENQNARAAADGTFEIGPLPPGRYEIAPSHRRLLFAPIVVEVGPGEGVRELGDRLGYEPARLSVRLAGDPARAARAEVALVTGERRLIARGEGGERTFAVGLLPGRHRLTVTIDGAEVAAEDIELAAGADARREIALR